MSGDAIANSMAPVTATYATQKPQEETEQEYPVVGKLQALLNGQTS